MRRFDSATFHYITCRGTVAVVRYSDRIQKGDRVQIAGLTFIVTGIETTVSPPEHMGLIVRPISVD